MSHAAVPLSACRSHPFSAVLGFQSNCALLPPQQYLMSTTGLVSGGARLAVLH